MAVIAVLGLFLGVLLGVFATSILQGLQQGVRDLSGHANGQQELLFFSTALRADMDRATAVRMAADGVLECLLDSGVVRYAADVSGIHRQLPNGDTMSFALPVAKDTALTLAPAIPLVTLWRLTFREEEGGGSAAYYKTYAPADVVRERTNHGDPHSDQP